MARVPDPDDMARPVAATPDLLARMRDGDAGARSLLFEAHYPRLRRALRLRLPVELRAEDAEDLVQTCLLRAVDKLDRFEYRGRGTFLAWLVRIAERIAIDELRHRQRSPQPKRWESVRQREGDTPQAAGDSPSRAAIRSEDRDLLERGLASLRPEDRELLVDREILGLGLGELAEQHGKGREAVRLMIYRAKHRLAQWLEQNT